MNWIKNSILIFFTLIFCYSLMIVGDHFILKTLWNMDDNETQAIEKLRIITEDLPQREKAVSEGFLPILPPRFFDTHFFDTHEIEYPLIAGIPETNTYYCNEGYGLIRYKSDRFGFRNDDSLWDKPSLKLMIGDSFVNGACVDGDSTLPVKLSKQLKSTVLNLGMSGSNPSHYFTYGNLFIPKLKPTEVFLVFYANDNGFFKTSEIEKKYIIEQKRLFSIKDIEFFNIERFKIAGKKAVSLYNENQHQFKKAEQKTFLKRVFYAFIKHYNLPTIRSKLLFKTTEGFEHTERTIRSINKLCNKYGCNLSVLYIPNSKYYKPDHRADIYGDSISKLSETLAIKFFDGRDVLDRKKGSVDFAIKGPHLSPLGYKKIATLISSQ